jgi:SAM-dependent MidA family methyltransferase
MTSLGMPAVPPPTSDPTWKLAWDDALYGAAGFYRRESPSAHFRTSPHVSDAFAGALVAMARGAGLDTVVDIGAGDGELLTTIRRLDPGLQLLGVEMAPRPGDLDPAIAWTSALPDSVDGLVIANEWLDNVPCHVVEVDQAGLPRVVHVDARTGKESLGSALSDTAVPASILDWVTRWWPLSSAAPGTRAEVGSTRDAAWSDVVRRVRRGLAVAVDYGHFRETRPPLGSLRSYREGREVDVVPDGSCDVTAHVAVDSVAERVGGVVRRQRDVLRELGVSGQPPPAELATSDPAAFLERLTVASQSAELTRAGGLGDFWWVVSPAVGA